MKRYMDAFLRGATTIEIVRYFCGLCDKNLPREFLVFFAHPLGNITKICYNTFNAPVSVTDANGIVTKYAYNDAGLVTRMDRLDGIATLTSLSVAYDVAGRKVREGSKTDRYGYLDKVMSVTDGDTTRTYTYHVDGQLATATVGGEHRAPRDRVGPPGGRPLPETETFLWDGLALIQRGGVQRDSAVFRCPQRFRPLTSVRKYGTIPVLSPKRMTV